MEYDASHKASSVTSISSSSSSWDPLPSLYTGRADSVSSAYELDDLQEPEPFESAPRFNYVQEEETVVLNNEGEKTFSEFLNSFFKEDNNNNNTTATTTIVKKEEVMDTLQQKRKRSIEEVELLSEDQKRANHIASEQKRRNTIRGGFKELTEIIPTLKNINNSKSTILFKSVDYIKQLDKRNKSLKDKLLLLQQRVKSRQEKKQMKQQQQVPNSIAVALLNHKNQQKQLELLQQQLRIQQDLLTKHNIPLYSTGYHSSISIPTMDDTPIHTSLPTIVNNHHQQQQQEHSYHHQHSHQQQQQQQQQQKKKITALVMPADDYPSFNIPADIEENNNHSFRERLLSSGKLNHLRKSSSTFML